MSARASMTASAQVELTLRLDANHAAALKRFAEKVSHSDAQAVLYPHLSADIRDEQAYQIIGAFADLDRALTDAGVRSWPWVETGSAS